MLHCFYHFCAPKSGFAFRHFSYQGIMMLQNKRTFKGM